MDFDISKNEHGEQRNCPSSSHVHEADSKDKLHVAHSLKDYNFRMALQSRDSSSRENSGKKKGKKAKGSLFETEINENAMEMDPPMLNASDGLVSLKYYREMENKLSMAVKEKDCVLDSLKKDIKIVEDDNAKYRLKLLELKEKFKEATKNIILAEEAQGLLENNHKKLLEIHEQLQIKDKTSSQQAADALSKVEHLEAVLNAERSAQGKKLEESWELVVAKDLEIEEIMKKLKVAGESNSNADNKEAVTLKMLLSEKNGQIKHLEGKLNDAVMEIEECTRTLLMLKSERSAANSVMAFPIVNHTNGPRANVEEKQLKKQLETLSHKLSLATERLRQFERNEYGLQEALSEIAELKQQVHIRDVNVAELVHQINSYAVNPGELMKNSEVPRMECFMSKRRRMRKQTINRTNFEKQLIHATLQRSKLPSHFIHEEINNKLIKWGKAVRVFRQSSRLFHKEIIKLTKQSLTEDDEGTAIRGCITTCTLEDTINQISNEVSTVRSYFPWGNKDSEEQGCDGEVAELNMKSSVSHNGADLDGIARKSSSSENRLEPKGWENLLHVLHQHNVNGQYQPAVKLEDNKKSSRQKTLSLKEESVTLSMEDDENLEEFQDAHSQIILLKSELEATISGKFPITVQCVLSDTLNLAKDIGHVLGIVDEWCLDGNTSIYLKKYLKNFHDRLLTVYQQYGFSYQHFMSTCTKREETNAGSENEENNQLILDEASVVQNINMPYKEHSGSRENFPEKIATVSEIEGGERNEMRLKGKCHALEHSIKMLRKEKEKLQMHLQSMKLIVIQKEENIIRQNEISKHQIVLLTRQLEESVQKSLFEEITKQLNELIVKHRNFMQMDKHSNLNEQLIKQQQEELLIVKKGKERIEGELKIALQRMKVLGTAGQSKEELFCNQDSNKITLLHERISNLEVEKKLAMEKNQTAEELHEILKSQLVYMQENNKELQTALTCLEKQNHELQLKEMQLQDRFNDFVNIAGHVNAISVFKHAEEEMQELRENCSKLKERAEIAEENAQSLQYLKSMKDAETEHLRQQILYLQSENEDKATLVRINDDLLHAQNIIAMNNDKIRFLEQQMENLNSENMELKQEHFGKDIEKLNIKKMMVAYCRELLLYILEMRMRYSGAVTLLNQEKVYCSHLKLIKEFTEMKLYVNKLEDVLHDGIKAPIEKCLSEDSKLKVISDEKLLASLLDKVKGCDDKLTKQGEYITKLENENTLLERQFEQTKSRWENREYTLLKELGQQINPESSMEDEIEEIVMNGLPPKVENTLSDDNKYSQHLMKNESQQLQVVGEEINLMEKWKHDAEISAQKNIIKELIEQLANAEFQLSEREIELKEIKEELAIYVSKQIERKSVEVLNEKEYPVHPPKEPPMKDFSFAYKITMEALNVILNQKDAALLRYRKQICENREAQVDTLLDFKVKQAVKSMEEHKDPNVGGQIHHQFIQQQPKQIYKPPEPTFSDKMMELHNEITLQKRKCDYLAVQLSLWESEAQRYRTLAEKRQMELEELLNREENQPKTCLNASCNFQVETSQNGSFYGRKDMLMDSVQEEPAGGLATINSSPLNKIMVDVETNTEAFSGVSDGQRESPSYVKETPCSKEGFSIVKGSAENIDQELETLSNLINNAEEASDERQDTQSVMESKPKPRAKLKHITERKINQSMLQITIEKLKTEKLEEQLHNCQLQLESLQNNGEKECKKRVELTKWEEGKKWQQSVDKLQERLKSEKKMVEDSKKLNSNLRDAIARLQREKTVLENKVRLLKKEKMAWNPDPEIQVEPLQKEILHLKKTMFDLEGVNISLKQRLDKYEREKKKARDKEREEKKENIIDDEHRGSIKRNHSMEVDLLKDEQENLKSENASAYSKINKLEEEIKYLKEEKNALEERIVVFLGKEETSSMIHNEVNALRLELARKTQLLQAVKGLLKRIHEKTKKNDVRKEDS